MNAYTRKPETCPACLSDDTYFRIYEYWEDDDSGNPIYLHHLVIGDENLTPESEVWRCNDCGCQFAVLLKRDGTRAH